MAGPVASGRFNANVAPLDATFEAAVCPETVNVVHRDPTATHTRQDARTGTFVDFGTETIPGRNLVYRPMRDLYTNADGGGQDSSGGHSYDLLAWGEPGVYKAQTVPDAIDGKSAQYHYARPTPGASGWGMMKNDLWVKDLSGNAIIVENEAAGLSGIADTGTTSSGAEGSDNHAGKGQNFGYMDGHVAFASSEREQVEAYLDSLIDMTYQPSRQAALDEVGITASTNADGLATFDY